jgi:hypothetical protein
MDTGNGILLDEIWLHIWYLALDGVCPLLPALHPAVHGAATLTLSSVCAARAFSSVCHAWADLLIERGVWRAMYHVLVPLAVRLSFPLPWYRVAALNVALGPVSRRDYIELTRCVPVPNPFVAGGYRTMKLPVWEVSSAAEDWEYVRITSDASLESISRAATGRDWHRVKTVRRLKYSRELHGNGRAVIAAWRAYCIKKAERAERENIMRALRNAY